MPGIKKNQNINRPARADKPLPDHACVNCYTDTGPCTDPTKCHIGAQHLEPNEDPALLQMPDLKDRPASPHIEQIEVPTTPVIPPFWAGPGNPISVGDCCKQDGYTVIVTSIIQAINGTVVVGAVKLADNKLHIILITKPEVHKLASLPRNTPEQEYKVQTLWEYECL